VVATKKVLRMMSEKKCGGTGTKRNDHPQTTMTSLYLADFEQFAVRVGKNHNPLFNEKIPDRLHIDFLTKWENMIQNETGISISFKHTREEMYTLAHFTAMKIRAPKRTQQPVPQTPSPAQPST